MIYNRLLQSREEIEYYETKDMVEYHLDDSLKNLNYENYNHLSKILKITRQRSKNKVKIFSLLTYVVIGLASISALIILCSPYFVFLSILLSAPLFYLYENIEELKETKQYKKYKKLYDIIKNKGKIKEVEAYLTVFEKNEKYEEEKRQYKLQESKKDLSEFVQHSSYEITYLERKRNELAGKPDNLLSAPENPIKIIDEKGAEHYYSGLGTALPLIARMIENNKVKITIQEKTKPSDEQQDEILANSERINY